MEAKVYCDIPAHIYSTYRLHIDYIKEDKIKGRGSLPGPLARYKYVYIVKIVPLSMYLYSSGISPFVGSAQKGIG